MEQRKETIICLEGLGKQFQTTNGTVTALDDINLEILKGEIFGIIGLSGAGKSTLVRCINYLEHDKVKKKYLQLNGEAEADFFLSQIIEEEVYLALKQAIDILPPKIRTIFYLILERKTNAEIASLLGITEEAVKAYRKRGMKMLRIRLSNFWILALLIF